MSPSLLGRFLYRLLRLVSRRGWHRPLGPVETGTVVFWDSEEGWGAVQTPSRSGVGFTHFSHIEGVEGYRELAPDDTVEFVWADDFEQDGCEWRVAWVRPVGRA